MPQLSEAKEAKGTAVQSTASPPPLVAVVVANRQHMATAGESRRRPLLSIGEVAVRLGVSVRHVRRLVAERRIPFVKWGRLLRFDPAELEEWIEHARVPAAREFGRDAAG